jgi:hypothetical protein
MSSGCDVIVIGAVLARRALRRHARRGRWRQAATCPDVSPKRDAGDDSVRNRG